MLAAPAGAKRVGAQPQVEPGATVTIEARIVEDRADANTTAWRPLSVVWRDSVHGADRQCMARVDLPHVARAVQLRVGDDDLARLRALTFEAVVPKPARPASPSDDRVVAVVVASSMTQAVLNGYQSRSAWGARAPTGCASNPPKTKVTIHHTVSALNNGGTSEHFASVLRGLQALLRGKLRPHHLLRECGPQESPGDSERKTKT